MDQSDNLLNKKNQVQPALFSIWLEICRKAAEQDPENFPILASLFNPRPSEDIQEREPR